MPRGVFAIKRGLGGLLALIACGASPWLAFGQAQAQSLTTLYQHALRLDPGTTGAQAQARAADARVSQARAAFYPTLSMTASESQSRYYDRQLNDSLRQFTNRQRGFQLNQPVMRVAATRALAQTKELALAAEWSDTAAQADLMQRLVEAYFEVLNAREALVLLRAQKQATGEQLAVAQHSFKTGTVSITDVREAEAKSDTVAAQEAAAEFDLMARQEILEQLAGIPVAAGNALSPQSPLPALARQDLAKWLDEIEIANPQVAQARHNVEAAAQEVRKAQAEHMPTVDINASDMQSSSNGSPTTPFGQSGRTVQAGVSVTWPLFAGGGTQAKVREALANRDKARSDVEAARLSARLQVRQAFYGALSALAQAQGLLAAERSAETALRANRRGYEVGMRINADVLNAQSQLFETRRDLIRARHDAWVQYFKLRAAAGRIGLDELAELDRALALNDQSGNEQKASPTP